MSPIFLAGRFAFSQNLRLKLADSNRHGQTRLRRVNPKYEILISKQIRMTETQNSKQRRQVRGGLTLVEALIAMAVLAIVALGAMGYQYYAALHARIARAQIIATRTAQLLLEDWKSTGDSTGGGLTTYDPYKLGLGFSAKLTVPAHWSYGTGGGAGSFLERQLRSICHHGRWCANGGDAQIR